MEGLLVLFLLIGAGFIAVWVMAGAAWFARFRRKRLRRTIMTGVAGRMRMTHADHHPLSKVPFALLLRGDGRGTANFLSGTWGGDIRVTAFDAWTYVNVTDNKAPLRKYTWWSCAVTEIAADFPQLTIYPETLGTKLLDRTGLGEDLQFESEAFNRLFEVRLPTRSAIRHTLNMTLASGRGMRGFRHGMTLARANNPLMAPKPAEEQNRFAYAFIDARMMDWLIQTTGTYRFEVIGRYLFVATKQATDLAPMLDTLRTFAQMIPRAAFTLFAGNANPVEPVPEPEPPRERPARSGPRTDAQLGWADDDPRLSIHPEDLPLAPDDPRIPKLREVITDRDTLRLLGIE